MRTGIVASSVTGLSMFGGTVTTSGGWVIHTFTDDGILKVTGGTMIVELLAVGGGGGGGGGASYGGAGGGGQVIQSPAFQIPAGEYPVVLGAGGVGGPIGLGYAVAGTDGGTTTIGSLLTAIGGGGGAGVLGTAGRNGASGGGGAGSTAMTPVPGGVGTAGFNGGSGHSYPGSMPLMRAGGGGGGATQAGATFNVNTATGPSGGKGIQSTISGANQFYADGGAGAYDSNTHDNIYATGGWGSGGPNGGTGGSADSRVANCGSGGGGGWGSGKGGNGSDGIVIVRYSDMTEIAQFGDSEPEDAWHPDDPIEELLDNLRRRIVLLAQAADTRGWGEPERLRSRLIDEDFAFVIERLRNDG